MFTKVTLLIIIFTAFSSNSILAQQQEVSGIVTDIASGEALPGVNISVKGTTIGTSTDREGRYELKVPSLEETLVFSFVGFETIEINISGRTEINVELQQGTLLGDDIVVVGYGVQSERSVTGAISSVDVAEVNRNLPNTNLTQSFTNVPGIVFKGSGRPGQGGELLIRGRNSLSANTDPLIVLDGIIFNGDISDINPQDVASMEVLKDASSTAIYGSRASNGVILVTSKEGFSTAQPSVNVNFFQSFSEPENLLNLISPERYLERRLDWRRQNGLDADPNRIAEFLEPDEAANLNAGITNRPWDVASRTGNLTSLDVSVAGRTNNVSYLISNNYSLDKGLLLNDKQERVSLRGNFDIDISDGVKVGTRTMYTNRDRSGLPASFNNIFRNSPFGTFFFPDGEPRQNPVSSERASNNAVYESILTTNEEISNNLFSNLYAILERPLFNGNLSFRVNYSPNLRWDRNFNSMRQDINRDENTTSASKFNRNSWKWELENILTYQGQLSEDHSFDTTLLFGRRHSETEFTNTNAGQLELAGLGFNNLSLGSTPTINSSKEEVEGVSYMGRLNYQYKDRYLFTITVRRDGSSVFAENEKYANLPSGAFAWIISDESFMKNINSINFLKIRVSHGKVGNEAIQPFQSLSLDETTRFVFGSDNPLGVITSTLGNEDLKWETTTTTNLGIDFELSEGRFGGTLELYNSNTNDLLVRRRLPITGGFESILTNIGEVNNRGIEISLNSRNIQKSNFSWSTSLTGSYNRNRINNLFGTDVDGDGREDDVIANAWFIDEPIDAFFDLAFDGIWQEGDDIPSGSQPGDVKFKDINGDGVINADDRQIVGSGQNPKYQFGLTNRFSYNNFDLSIGVNAMLGWKGGYQLIQPLVPGRAFGGIDNDWWTAENRSNSRPSLAWQNSQDINFYFSRSFLRIQDVSLSYEFNKETLNRIVGLNTLRIFISGKNLHTFTNWPGSDPESAEDINTQQGPGQNGAFPMSRSVTLGINLGI